jgi:hypothetical protein
LDSDVQTESYIKTFPIKSLNIWKINKLGKDIDNTKMRARTEGFYNIHQLDRINVNYIMSQDANIHNSKLRDSYKIKKFS